MLSPTRYFSGKQGNHERSDPLGFDEGDVISNDVSDFQRRLQQLAAPPGHSAALLPTPGSPPGPFPHHHHSDQGHDPAFATGVQYSKTGDMRPPFVRKTVRSEEDVEPDPVSTSEKKTPLPDDQKDPTLHFVRPKYHEEG